MAGISKKEINAPRPATQAEQPLLNHEQEKINQWLQTTKFRKKVFGGVDEVDVWKKIEELNRLYEAALIAERARYDTMLRLAMGKDSTQTPVAAHTEEPPAQPDPKTTPEPKPEYPEAAAELSAQPVPESGQFDDGHDLYEFFRKEGL